MRCRNIISSLTKQQTRKHISVPHVSERLTRGRVELLLGHWVGGGGGGGVEVLIRDGRGAWSRTHTDTRRTESQPRLLSAAASAPC